MKWLAKYFTLSASEQRGIYVWIVAMIFLIILPEVYLRLQPIEVHPIPDELIAHMARYDSLKKATKALSIEKDSLLSIKKKDAPKQANIPYSERKDQDNLSYTEKSRAKKEKVDINLADSTALTTVYGLGPVLSSRIVKFRDLLGGFVQMEQLMEVYGITEERYAQISPQLTMAEQEVRLIPVNTATFAVLIRHPYLNKEQVRVLLNYRDLHGNFTDIGDLRNTRQFTDAELMKLQPYISFQ